MKFDVLRQKLIDETLTGRGKMKLHEIKNETAREGLLTAMQMRKDAYGMEKRVDELKADAKRLIEAFVSEAKDGMVDGGEMGKIQRVRSVRKTFDADTWRHELLVHGLDAGTIRTIENTATTCKPITSYHYTMPKGD